MGEGTASNAPATAYVPELRRKYNETIVPALLEEFAFSSVMQVPRIEKVVLSMGVGEATSDKKTLESAVNELTLIAGQKAVKTKARKSISNFKLREGMEIGAKVTLRSYRMWDFLHRLFNVGLPRVKDFRGINPNGFDGHGNFSLGIQEQIIFPEIDYDKIDRVNGLNITIVTTARTDEEAKSLLGRLGMPFRG